MKATRYKNSRRRNQFDLAQEMFDGLIHPLREALELLGRRPLYHYFLEANIKQKVGLHEYGPWDYGEVSLHYSVFNTIHVNLQDPPVKEIFAESIRINSIVIVPHLSQKWCQKQLKRIINVIREKEHL